MSMRIQSDYFGRSF